MAPSYTLPPKEQVCCFTGHRDLSKEEYLELRPILQEKIEKLFLQGVDTFIAGGALGIVGMHVMPDFPVHDYISAFAVGIVSGLAAVGVNQIGKQMTKEAE